MLLRERREDEIGMSGRQKAQLGLCATRDSASPDAAVSYSNFGLDYLITGSPGIARGVEKSHQALALVILEQIPAHRQSKCAYQRDDGQISPLNSGHQNPDR